MQPDVVAFFDEDTFTVSYLVGDPATRRARSSCTAASSVNFADPTT